MAAELLKDLPCSNKENFTKFNPDNHHRASNSKKSTYLSTKDYPPEQIIVSESTNILLRYLHQQWDKKTNNTKKRQGEADGQEEVPGKKARLESDYQPAPGPSRLSGQGGSSSSQS